ncbi:hypothetical protein [Nostoc sp.]|uniref:hypothetical protein n=1 Tax=Nostoc sp. TaxID=1180 RepID=UPI002FF64728
MKLHQKISEQSLKASIHQDNSANRRVEKEESRGAGGDERDERNERDEGTRRITMLNPND